MVTTQSQHSNAIVIAAEKWINKHIARALSVQVFASQPVYSPKFYRENTKNHRRLTDQFYSKTYADAGGTFVKVDQFIHQLSRRIWGAMFINQPS